MVTSFCIGVVTRNRPKDLCNLLQTLEPQLKSRTHIRLVVVNDGSHSKAYQKVIDKFPRLLEYRILPKNTGPGPARHAAFINANEDYLICTDDDCLPPQQWLAWIEAIIAANPEVDLFAGVAPPMWMKKPGYLSRLLTVPHNYPRPIFSENGLLTAVGANTVLRNEAYKRTGGYSAEMNGAAEDCWLTQKMLKTGSSYTVLHGANTSHKAETGLRELWRRFYYYGMGGAQYTLLEQDWGFAKMGSGPHAKDRRKSIMQKISVEWNNPHHVKEQFLKRFAYSAITALTSWAYERGWRKGVGEYSEKYDADLPAPPPVYERFVDFANVRSAMIALGKKS